MKCTLLPAGVLLAMCLRAQPMTEPLSARPAQLSALAPSFRNALSFSANPAALGGNGKLILTAAGERRFVLSELGSYALAARIPLAGNGVGIRIGQGTAPGWRAGSVAAAYGMQLGSLAAIGLGVAHSRFGAPAARAGILEVQAGGLLRLQPKLLLGLSAIEPVRRAADKATAGGEARYAMAVGWEEPGQWMLGAELSQAGDRPPGFSAGFQLAVGRAVRAGAGIDTALSSMYLTVALPLAGMLLQPSVMVHRELGVAPGFLLSYPAQ
ncbi:MAG: hypothetical protein EOO16_08585 [Chitinophagaceae bacterium]|nr:MAG: hypothetical protein EOO16_08585 [Chitinophagaceae bacterium]